MAAKRSASAQLTSDNWEQEDENEEPTKTGFVKASAEELEKRPMKTARRTLATGGAKVGGKLFSSVDLSGGLKPFGSSLLSTKPPFLPATSQPLSSSLAMPSFMTPPQTDTRSKYIKKLCALNESVSQWISDHVKKNPCIDLTPIFEDYKKYLKELDTEKEDMEETVAMTTTSVTMETGGKGNEAMENGGGADDEDEEGDEEQPDETEKEEKKQLDLIQETEDDTDCLLALRTKLYYKKDNKFVELGIGKLRVEEIEKEGGGVRLLLRNDTTLKQILLNIRVNSQVPMTLQKNNLLIVCPPNPPLESKSPSKSGDPPDEATPLPVTYALRVKDSNMAEQLHSTIKNKL